MEEVKLPTTAGAYVLFVELNRPLAIPETSLGPAGLAPGRYAYCGSAYGPGGLGARLRRHLRPDKAVRWHVDHLTAGGRIIALGLAPGGQECALLEGLCRRPGVTVPLAGFGSSDCARCPAHLLRIERTVDPRGLAEALGLVWIDRSLMFGAVLRR